MMPYPGISTYPPTFPVMIMLITHLPEKLKLDGSATHVAYSSGSFLMMSSFSFPCLRGGGGGGVRKEIWATFTYQEKVVDDVNFCASGMVDLTYLNTERATGREKKNRGRRQSIWGQLTPVRLLAQNRRRAATRRQS